MGSALNLNRTWAGFYVKSSGDLAVAGYESYSGIMWGLDDPYYRRLGFTCKNFRLGAGLGGSFSAGLIFFFNVGHNLWYIEEQSLGHGWNLSLDFPIAKKNQFYDLVKGIKDIQQAYEILSKIDELRGLAIDIWKASNFGGGQPIIHVLAELNVGLSGGLMRSFGGKIDILAKHGRGGYVSDL